MNTEQVIAAYGQGLAKRSCRSIWTNGLEIFSYGTRMLWREADGTICLNVRKYSVTTTRHQSGLRWRFGRFVKLVNGPTVEFGEASDKCEREESKRDQQEHEDKQQARQLARATFRHVRDESVRATREYEKAALDYVRGYNGLKAVLSPGEMKVYDRHMERHGY